ncbi:hypothetical protein C8R44DRAFT_799408 [Mycena epipterygia]|nr:hypothetical protein C8R44DRAFT_799408 [Mycena epipterygia]
MIGSRARENQKIQAVSSLLNQTSALDFIVSPLGLGTPSPAPHKSPRPTPIAPLR